MQLLLKGSIDLFYLLHCCSKWWFHELYYLWLHELIPSWMVNTVMDFSIRGSINLRNCLFCHCNFNNSRSAKRYIFGPNMVIWVIRGSNNSRNSNSRRSNFYNSRFRKKYLFSETWIIRANTVPLLSSWSISHSLASLWACMFTIIN